MDIQTAKQILSHITDAQREGAELMMHAHGILTEIKTGHRDVVTAYDRRIQALLVERLSAAVPGAKFFCEENDQQDGLDAEHLFIIDPIDGTMNFVRGMQHSCISVAYMNRGELWAGAVYNPYLDELFTAVKGAGAALNGRPIHVEEVPLSETVVCCGTAPYRPDLSARTFDLIRRSFDTGLDIRREGSAALDLCSVAAGRAGAYFELNLSLWDYAAGVLLVREAGGLCTTVDGAPLPFDSSKPSILAAGPRAHADFLAMAGE